MIYTTLNRIQEHDPCREGWERLLKHLGKTWAYDEPLGFDVILESNGLDDCLWAARSAPEHDATWRLFGCECAERVLQIFEAQCPGDGRPRVAIEIARLYAFGEATDDERAAARAAALDAADSLFNAAGNAAIAARAAARAAARHAGLVVRLTADGGFWAVKDAGKDAGAAERDWQKGRLLQRLNETGGQS